MIVIIDSREKKRTSEALEYYNGKGHTAKISTLDVGDYLFSIPGKDDHVVFEFKLASDFISSIKDESLFNEAVNQAQVYPYHYVILCGSIVGVLEANYNKNKKIRRMYPNVADYYRYNTSQCTGAIRRLRTFTTVIECNTVQGAFKEMLLQAEKCLHGKSYGGVVRPVLHTYNPVEYLLCGVHGVSSNKSQTIIDELKLTTMNDLLECTAKDFTKVQGIGCKTAENIELWINKTTDD
jgi:ERCC4-type nuclease